MDAARSKRVWTLWLQTRPGRRPEYRGKAGELTEAWKLWEWVVRHVRAGTYWKTEGELRLMSPEQEVLATCDVGTGDVEIRPTGVGLRACERAGINDGGGSAEDGDE